MARKTILSIVQSTLNDLDLDPVDDINDTAEALQIAYMVGSEYEAICSRRKITQNNILMPLVALSDSNFPNYMRLPDGTQKLEWIKYNTRTLTGTRSTYTDIKETTPDEFLFRVQVRDDSLDTVDSVVDFGGSTILIQNDSPPAFWTSFDDTHIVFDSYDKEVDTTLQDSKSQAYLRKSDNLVIDNNVIPDLPDDAFSHLIANVKNLASSVLNQEVNPILNRRAGQLERTFSQNNWKAQGGIRFQKMSRRPKG